MLWVLAGVLALYVCAVSTFFGLDATMTPKWPCGDGTSQLTLTIAKFAPSALLAISCIFTFEQSFFSRLPLFTFLALMAYGVGGWFLTINSTDFFLGGVGAFGAGHLFSIASFITTMDPRKGSFWLAAVPLTIILASIDAAIIYIILTESSGLASQIVLPCYATILATVTWFAFIMWCMTDDYSACSTRTRAIGYVIFCLSDILLVMGKLMPTTFNCVQAFDLLLYYTALLCIFSGNVMQSIEEAVAKECEKG